VANVGLLVFVHNELSVLLNLNSCILTVDAFSEGVATNSEKHGIKFVGVFLAFAYPGNLDLSCGISLLEFGGKRVADELGSTQSHMSGDTVGHILIKSTEED